MKIIIKVAIAAIIGIGLYLVWKDPDYHLRQLRKGIDELKSGLPKQVEEHLTWQRIDLQDRKVTYTYIWTDPDLVDLDRETLILELEPNLRDFLCKDEEAEIFRRAKANVTYVYVDANDEPIIAIDTFIADCPEKAPP